MPSQWILRRGSRPGRFTYRTERGEPVTSPKVLERIAALAVPPAWTDVHIAASPNAAVQAWGFDAKGRKQYRYHEKAVEQGALRKYQRVRQLARDLPAIRRTVTRDVRQRRWGKERVAAVVVRLIADAFLRVGSDRYVKENGTYGISTLMKKHVAVAGNAVTFDYVGKKSIRQKQVVVDRGMAKIVGALLETPGPRLFRWQDEEGGWHDLTARDVNDYLRATAGARFSAKDFRTWGGTLRAAIVLAELGPPTTPTEAKRNVNLTLRLVAHELGNTPTICRASYVHPLVLGLYADRGATIELDDRRQRTRRDGSHAAEERGLIRFLDRHFPDRRRRRRSA